MKNSTACLRKQRELFLLKSFIETANIDAQIIEECESPDFIVRVNGRAIGVEVTEMFISHDRHANTIQKQESISSLILAAAQEHYRASGAPPAHVTVCFGPGHDLRNLNRDHTAEVLSKFIQDLKLAVWQQFYWFPEELDGPLPYEISCIHAMGVPSFDMAHWAGAQSGWVVLLEALSLQSRIDEKAKLLYKYKSKIAENWLLIVADATKPSQLIEANVNFDPSTVSSPFSRAFFYSYPSQLILEIHSRIG